MKAAIKQWFINGLRGLLESLDKAPQPEVSGLKVSADGGVLDGMQAYVLQIDISKRDRVIGAMKVLIYADGELAAQEIARHLQLQIFGGR